MDNQELHALLSKLSREELAKGMKEFLGLSGIRDIEDLWQDIHAVPTKEQIKTGPAMVSSGQGADRAMKDYASPAPQEGITKQYEEFDANIAGWQEVRGSIKSLATEIKEGMAALAASLKPVSPTAVAKAEETKAEEAPVTIKATSDDWDKLAELQQAYAESQGLNGVDSAELMKAVCFIEEAETHLDASKCLEAHKAIAKGWAALAKAKRKVESVAGMMGDGNQEDAAVPAKAPLKVARAKARYWAEKAAALEGKVTVSSKAKCSKCGASMKAKEEEEEKEEVEVNIEQGEDEEEDEKKKSKKAAEMKVEKADKEDEKEDEKESEKESGDMVEKAKEGDASFKKAVANRLALIEKRLSEPRPGGMVPLIISENGIKTEAMSKSIMDKVSEAVDNGELTDEGATQARGLIDRYRAAAKGHLAVDIVNQQLGAASLEVQNFFESFQASSAQ